MRRPLAVASWLAVTAVLVTLACDPEDGPLLLFAEDFETICDGAPCGWTRTSGGPEQATWEETLHPGEHGLRLTGEVTVRGPAAPDSARRLRGTVVEVQLAHRCELGSTLSVSVVFEDASTGSLRDATLRVLSEPAWTAPAQTLTLPDPPLIGGRVVAVILTKGGAGVCEVGDLTVNTTELCLDGCC